jgi:hypothetical protein
MSFQTSESKKQRHRERRIKVVLMLGSMLVSLAIVEIGLRIAGYSYPEFYAADAERGYALRPGMEGWYRKEGAAFVRINSDGLRDREHAKEKPPNTTRIAVLGDSFTEALQVPYEDSYAGVLERKLKECAGLSGANIEVINFGVSGYGTAQELITLRNHVWQYSPDVVLLAVTTNNDISDNERGLKKTDEIPYFVWHDGKLSQDDSFRQTRTFRWRTSALNRFGGWFRDHLRLVQLIIQAHHGIKAHFAERRAASEQAHSEKTPAPSNSGSSSQAQATPAAPQDGVAAAEELGVDNVVYREATDPVWNDAWKVTEQLIAAIRDDVQGKGRKFLVVTLSNGIQVWPDPAARDAFIRRVGAKDIFYPDKRIREFCEHENIPVVTLAPAMQKYADINKIFLHGFGEDMGNGHWNTNGHRVAAELTAQQLCGLF